jgi:hypothetical protein
MIRHPGRDLQESFDLLVARARLAQPARRNGAALHKAGEALIHGIFIRLE